MDNGKFKEILERAINGNNEAIEKIFELYEPIINKFSILDGKLDEDLRQYILFRIFRAIKKYRIE